MAHLSSFQAYNTDQSDFNALRKLLRHWSIEQQWLGYIMQIKILCSQLTCNTHWESRFYNAEKADDLINLGTTDFLKATFA